MNLFHRQQSGRKQTSPAAMRGIIIFTSAFLAVSNLACSSSQNQINSKGGGSVVGSRLMEREDPPKGQAAQDSLKNVIPSRTDTLILTPAAKKLVEARIKQLDEERKKIPVPGGLRDDEPITNDELRWIVREMGFLDYEKFACRAALEGNRKNYEDAKNRIKGVGEKFGQETRADRIIDNLDVMISSQ